MQTLIDTALNFWNWLPTWVQVLPVLLGGWVLALLLRLFVSGVLGLIRVDQAAERAGIVEFLRKGQVTYTPSKLVGVLVFWIALGGVLVKVAHMLNVGIVKVFAARFAEIMPGIIVAALIGMLGLVAVMFVANLVVTIIRNAGFAHAGMAGRAIKWIGVIMVCLIAFEQVSVGQTMLSPLAQILFGAIAFGTALAFGLGCKDLARDFALRVIAALRERNRPAAKSDLED